MKRKLLLAIILTALPLGWASAFDQSDLTACNRSGTDPDAAIAGCTNLIGSLSDRETAKLLILRARAYAAKSRFDSALADLDRAASLQRDSASPIMERGNIHSAMHQEELAIADYTSVLNRDPQNYPALSNRCGSRAILGRDLERALEDCNSALLRVQNTGPDLAWRALIYLRMGRFSDAQADYTKEIAYKDGRLASCYYGRGIAKLRLGDPTGGKADISTAMALKRTVTDEFARYGLSP